jgi:23S rRNA (guanosine2251-2'-O)-methyltransferase
MNQPPIIIMENIRSAYNVGNILRTADALGRDACCAWYTPHPHDAPKVHKTALWALSHKHILHFWNPTECYTYYKNAGYFLIAGEITDDAIPLSMVREYTTLWACWDMQSIIKQDMRSWDRPQSLALIVGSETDWILWDTLKRVDLTVAITMQWVKESLNVWQAAAIMMWEFSQIIQRK